ncbi:methyl-accepting chemotaxis protein [Hyphomicrobium sp.]|uniref:methyl-accepting chemotaxis protein n=1 Tax=Hyphomicrobium sp. TaxID=82 RepID=UPI002E2FD4F5|nr:methyl-accepting chemotaxis protein [Hyphomicrobium sp.]HEX2843090.1 methyl-accepting chemotaxis protein [Hyphomicrobium sp.]
MSSIKSRLLISLAFLFAAIVTVAWIGHHTSRVASGGLETVFQDRVKPLRDLKAVSDLYAVNIVDTAHKVRNGNLTWDAGLALVVTATQEIGNRWGAYASTYMPPEEKAFAEDAKRLMGAADTAVAEFVTALKAKDHAALDSFVINKLYPAIDPLSEGISKIVSFQIDEAERQYHIAENSVARANWGMIAGLVLAAAAFAFALWTTIAAVARPLSAITDCMLRLARGERGLSIPGAGRKDEVGSMAQAVQVFKDNAEETLRLREAQKEAEERAAQQRKADMHKLASQFQAAVGGIIDTVSAASAQLESAANALTQTASTTHERSGSVAAASEQTSANVQGVAAASEQLASTVTEISRQVQTSSSIAQDAVKQASMTNARVTELSQSADRIGDVIGLINTIAGQTNLLALNATIEAARAGDAGKGFAVVAQEVKALASQTAKATSEIEQQIAHMQTATKDAVDAISEITGTINKMSEIAGAIAAAVEEQGATTQEISRNVIEAAKGTAEVASSITEVSRGASETGSASSQVLSSAKSLSSDSRTLKSEVEKFLVTVRAA